MRSISVFCFVALFSVFLDAQVSEDVRRINVSDLNMENIYEPDRMETDLLVAAALGPTEGLKRFINLIGGEVNGLTRLGETVLTELVDYLDLKYTPGDFHERFGVPYDRALILRNIKVLVDSGLDMDARNENGETALIKSIRKGYFEGREARYIKKLIELGANPDATDIRGETALFAVVRHKPKNSPLIMETLVEWGEVNAWNYQGMPLLGVAMEVGNYEDMRRLVKLGADPDVQNRQGVPLLTVAMENGNYEDMRRLVRLGADPDVTDRMGQTALSGAIFSHSFDKKEEGAKVLIELGADVNAVVAGGQSILQRVLYFYAQQTEFFNDGGRSKRMAEKRIRFLLLNGADVSEHQAQQVIDILGRQEFQELAKSQKLKASTLNNCYSAVSKVGS